jgi:hypothetical protein
METRMNKALRQHYCPEARRLPDWLRRVWLWF